MGIQLPKVRMGSDLQNFVTDLLDASNRVRSLRTKNMYKL